MTKCLPITNVRFFFGSLPVDSEPSAVSRLSSQPLEAQKVIIWSHKVKLNETRTRVTSCSRCLDKVRVRCQQWPRRLFTTFWSSGSDGGGLCLVRRSPEQKSTATTGIKQPLGHDLGWRNEHQHVVAVGLSRVRPAKWCFHAYFLRTLTAFVRNVATIQTVEAQNAIKPQIGSYEVKPIGQANELAAKVLRRTFTSFDIERSILYKDQSTSWVYDLCLTGHFRVSRKPNRFVTGEHWSRTWRFERGRSLKDSGCSWRKIISNVHIYKHDSKL